MPDTTVCVANAETVSLGLDADRPMTAVRLLPRFGAVREIPLDSDGTFEFPVFPPPESVRIDWLDASGSGKAVFTSYATVVSRHYFSIKSLETYGHDQDDFDKLPEDELWAARQAATEVFEESARRSFVHRIGRTKDYGRDSLLQLWHGDAYELLTEGYVQVSGSQLERIANCCGEPFPRWVEYLYGADVMPAEVSRAVLELAAYTLRPSNRPVGATGESSEAGYIHFITAGRDGATAIPEVNAAIEQFGRGERFVW